MSYAIITVGGKQYRVQEGERLLVDRLKEDEGKTFKPKVLLIGGNGETDLAPSTTVTARVVSHELGEKIRIGKYKPKSGYKRHNGFRSSLTRIEVTGIGGKQAVAKAEAPAVPKEKAPPAPKAAAKAPAAPKAAKAPEAPKGLPKGYAEMTVAQISEGSKSWNRPMLEAAHAYEQDHAKRKGALAALESALAAKEAS